MGTCVPLKSDLVVSVTRSCGLRMGKVGAVLRMGIFYVVMRVDLVLPLTFIQGSVITSLPSALVSKVSSILEASGKVPSGIEILT